jgi:hypothetical protein
VSNWDLSPRIKWLVHEADYSLPSSAEVKNAWNCISTPQFVYMMWCLVKQSGSFTFYLYPVYVKKEHLKTF